ncbi:MAG TPA: M1 family aminopeptidase [Candidatus Baltobacteraceae bacterium]|nr:M1 family aminopeptidase [Candidatus Baltobacteraceae bacterium]
MTYAFVRTSLVAAGVVLAAALTAAAAPAPFKEAPFNFDAAPGRLPKTVVPLDYRVAIVPNAEAKTLTGTESVVLQVRKPVTTIVFNSLNERLHDVRLDGVAVAGVDSSDAKQLTTLTLAHPATVGRHTLTFSYDGKLETAPQGLFVQPYRLGNGTTGTMLSTQFEATDARRMFPCWDEPAFRSTFQLTATVPAAWATVSNMPIATHVVHGATATTTFERTPKMPTYLVEFSAGDLAHIDATSGGKLFRVWAVRGQQQNGRYALANAQQILADYDRYFAYTFPLPKLDSIAVPGGFSGAMENWGAITYNDQILLLPPDSTLGRRQAVYSVQAHEMAHQWNGDLVTMGWWDDIWLNESFASWMSAKETAIRNPSWNWWEGQDESKESAMNADARPNSHAIQQHVTDELQAEASFDPAITYDKGQAFLRMLEAYLGPDTFRDGVRRYIKARAFSNATSADLWNGLSAASGKDVAALASGWTEQPGFPLVSETTSCDASGNRTVTLTQKRFLLEGSDPNDEHWNVPLNVRSGDGTPQTVLFTSNGQTAPAGRCDQPLSLNAGDIGFFRVAYDPKTFATNVKAFGTIPDPDKIALLDDQWALAEANQAPLSSYFALASSMGKDLDARAWTQIIGALGTIEQDERGTPGYAKFVAFAHGIVRPVFDRLGWDAKPDESPQIQDLRREVIGALAYTGDPQIIAEAKRRFERFITDRSSLSPDDQDTVLAIVALNADQATFDQLHAIAKSAKDEAEVRRFYGALMLVRDPKLAQEALQIAMSPEIPPQAAGMRVRLVMETSQWNPQVAWAFFKAHNTELLSSLSQFERALSFTQVPAIFWRAAPLDELHAYVVAHTPASAGVWIERGMERARFSLALKNRLVPEADQYVAQHAST